MYIHPERNRFIEKWIYFTPYNKNQLELDYEDEVEDEKAAEEELQKARDKFVIDDYPEDEKFTPMGWTKKMIGIDNSVWSEYVDAFQPDYNEVACDKIQEIKRKKCKAEDKKPIACKPDDTREVLKEKHDRNMICRNIRAIESFSNCRNKKYKRWIKSNAINHTSQTNSLARSAAKCVDYYIDRDKEDKKKRGVLTYPYIPSDPKGYVHYNERKKIGKSKSKSRSNRKGRRKGKR